MSLAYESLLRPGSGSPVHEPAEPSSESSLEVTVVFTTVEATLAALREAGAVAHRLGGRITLVVTQIVPYPLPLTSPPVLIDWNERRLRVLAADSPVEMKVLVYLCRDQLDALLVKLRPHSIVVLGSRKRWWPNGEKRLAKSLRRAGHEVIFKETEKSQCSTYSI